MKYFLTIFVSVFFLTVILASFIKKTGLWGIGAVIALIAAVFGSVLIKLSDRIDSLEEKLRAQDKEETEETETSNTEH